MFILFTSKFAGEATEGRLVEKSYECLFGRFFGK